MGYVGTRGLIRRFRYSWFNRKKVEKTLVSPALRRRLEDEFAPDVARLSEMLGRDLGALWFGRSVKAPPKAAERQVLAAS